MINKSLAIILVMMLLITALSGCGQKAPVEPEGKGGEKAVLRWNLNGEPKTIDPQLNSASDGGHVINNTFEGLMREVNGKLEPAIDAASISTSLPGSITIVPESRPRAVNKPTSPVTVKSRFPY